MEIIYLNGNAWYVNSFQVNIPLYFIAFYFADTEIMGKIDLKWNKVDLVEDWMYKDYDENCQSS